MGYHPTPFSTPNVKWMHPVIVVNCVLYPLMSVWFGGSDTVPGCLELVAIEVWLILLSFSASNCYLSPRVRVLPQPLDTKSPLTAAPCPESWLLGSGFPGVPRIPVCSTYYGMRFLHRSPCIRFKMACEMLVFEEFTVFKASLWGMRKKCPCPWIPLGLSECFCLHLHPHPGFWPLQDSHSAQIWTPSFLSLSSDLQLKWFSSSFLWVGS